MECTKITCNLFYKESILQQIFKLMKKIAFLVTFSVFADPAVVTKKFKVANFKSVEIGSAFEIHVHKGNVYSVSITGREKDFEDLEVTSSGGKLELGLE